MDPQDGSPGQATQVWHDGPLTRKWNAPDVQTTQEAASRYDLNSFLRPYLLGWSPIIRR